MPTTFSAVNELRKNGRLVTVYFVMMASLWNHETITICYFLLSEKDRSLFFSMVNSNILVSRQHSGNLVITTELKT